MQYVSEADKGSFVYKKGEIECKLMKGPSKFEDCIVFLEKTEPMKPLTVEEELTIDLPAEKNDWVKQDVMKALIEEKKTKLTKCVFKAFHFDIGTSIMEPEAAVVLQLVDDSQFNGQRRLQLMDSTTEFIGLSIKKLKTKGCAYFSFGAAK